MTWVKIISGIVEVVNKILNYLNVQELKKAGRDEQQNRDLEELNKNLKKAHDVKHDDLSDDWLYPTKDNTE